MFRFGLFCAFAIRDCTTEDKFDITLDGALEEPGVVCFVFESPLGLLFCKA